VRPLSRKLVVEFIGTLFLVYTVGMATNPKTLFVQPAEKVEGDIEAARASD
jgi:hypothetical protein